MFRGLVGVWNEYEWLVYDLIILLFERLFAGLMLAGVLAVCLFLMDVNLDVLLFVFCFIGV